MNENTMHKLSAGDVTTTYNCTPIIQKLNAPEDYLPVSVLNGNQRKEESSKQILAIKLFHFIVTAIN